MIGVTFVFLFILFGGGLLSVLSVNFTRAPPTVEWSSTRVPSPPVLMGVGAIGSGAVVNTGRGTLWHFPVTVV